jgi:hypothetical protein
VIAEMAMGLVLAMPPKAKPTPPAQCKDRAALMLWRAGFKGERNRIAWSITWRESRHQNLVPGHPQYNGSDVGIWQTNRGAHGGASWWDESAMRNPERQSRIVYRIVSQRGTYWRPWGITSDGRGMDTSHYGMWSSWQHHNWIWAPYSYARSIYPKECAR